MKTLGEKYLQECVNYLNKDRTDETFLQRIEKQAGVREPCIDDYRRQVLAYVGAAVWNNRPITLPLKLQAVLDSMSRPRFQVTIEGED